MSHALTAREIEVVREAARGLADKEIGRALGISSFTVRNHLRTAREKTGLTNRTQLAMYAIKTGLAPMPEVSVCLP